MFLDPKKPAFFARYHYYAMKILNRPTPWKRWITKLQIVQFATSFALLGKTLWHYQRSDCAGMKALVYNCIFNATLIVQFIGVDKRNKAQKKEWFIICHEISLKKPIFNWEFSFQQPIFLRVKICRCLLSWGCYDPSIFIFLLRFPRLQETEKKNTKPHPWP